LKKGKKPKARQSDTRNWQHDFINAQECEIYTATTALADKASTIPGIGMFDCLSQSVGSINGSGEVVLELAANPLQKTLRFVELRVHTKSGKSWMGRWILQGKSEEIIAALRKEELPAQIVRVAKELQLKLFEEEYL